jgi:hypothetical protein
LEEHISRLFENKLLRKIFGPRTDATKGGCRNLHTDKLHKLYSSENADRLKKSMRMRRARRVVRIAEKKDDYTVLVGRPEGKKPPGRPRLRWEENIKMGS